MFGDHVLDFRQSLCTVSGKKNYFSVQGLKKMFNVDLHILHSTSVKQPHLFHHPLQYQKKCSMFLEKGLKTTNKTR